MTALDQVLTIGIVKLEHPNLHKEAAAELAALKEANKNAVELLKTAKDLLDGTHGLCDKVDSEEWLWKWRVRYYLEETDIPVHEMPQDMK